MTLEVFCFIEFVLTERFPEVPFAVTQKNWRHPTLSIHPKNNWRHPTFYSANSQIIVLKVYLHRKKLGVSNFTVSHLQCKQTLPTSTRSMINTGRLIPDDFEVQSKFAEKYRTIVHFPEKIPDKIVQKGPKIPENQSKKGPKIPDYSKGLVLWPKIPDKYRTKLVQIGQKIPDRTSPNKGSSGKNHTACMPELKSCISPRQNTRQKFHQKFQLLMRVATMCQKRPSEVSVPTLILATLIKN